MVGNKENTEFHKQENIEQSFFVKHKKLLLQYFLFPIIIVFATIFGNQIFRNYNQRSDYLVEFKKESLRIQYPFLKKLKSFSDKGKTIAVLNLRNRYIFIDTVNKNRNEYSDNEGIVYNLPLIIIDSIAYNEWFNIQKEIEDNKELIDEKVYSTFKDILLLYDNNKVLSLRVKDIEKSKWFDPNFIGRWLALHEILDVRIEILMELKE